MFFDYSFGFFFGLGSLSLHKKKKLARRVYVAQTQARTHTERNDIRGETELTVVVNCR